MFATLTNFPKPTVRINLPHRDSRRSEALHECNPEYLRGASSFFGILEGKLSEAQLHGRIHHRRTWKGDDVTRQRTMLRDEAGQNTGEWSDWYDKFSTCAEFDVYDASGEVAATLFIRFGNGNPDMSFVAQVGIDAIELLSYLQFWDYDRDLWPMGSGSLFDETQKQQFDILEGICLSYVK